MHHGVGILLGKLGLSPDDDMYRYLAPKYEKICAAHAEKAAASGTVIDWDGATFEQEKWEPGMSSVEISWNIPTTKMN